MSEKDIEAVVEEEGTAADPTKELNDSDAPQNKEDATDWKAMAEKMTEERDNYKKALSQKRQLRGKTPISGVEQEETATEEDKLLNAVRQVINEDVVPLVQANKVDTELERLVKDPNKRAVVKFNYENRIRQMGTSDDAIRNDLAAALALTDASKLKVENSELTRKANMQQEKPISGPSNEAPAPSKTHKFSTDQVARLTETARRLGADPAKFIENAWKNQSR